MRARQFSLLKTELNLRKLKRKLDTKKKCIYFPVGCLPPNAYLTSLAWLRLLNNRGWFIQLHNVIVLNIGFRPIVFHLFPFKVKSSRLDFIWKTSPYGLTFLIVREIDQRERNFQKTIVNENYAEVHVHWVLNTQRWYFYQIEFFCSFYSFESSHRNGTWSHGTNSAVSKAGLFLSFPLSSLEFPWPDG